MEIYKSLCSPNIGEVVMGTGFLTNWSISIIDTHVWKLEHGQQDNWGLKISFKVI